MQLLKHSSLPNHSPVAELYLQYGPALLMYIRRYIPLQEDAEDVLLEVFLAALESDSLSGLDARRQKSWLWSVAHNKVIDHYRRFKRRPATPLEEAEEALYDDDQFAPEAVTLRHETQDVLRTHISSLGEQQQKILSLRFAHGLHSSEIATLLNKSDAAIRQMLSRTLNFLRDAYQESGKEKYDG
jgi:RNA polymerase sigma factor (sigma-70 family)